jgi:hypothetical protein
MIALVTLTILQCPGARNATREKAVVAYAEGRIVTASFSRNSQARTRAPVLQMSTGL